MSSIEYRRLDKTSLATKLRTAVLPFTAIAISVLGAVPSSFGQNLSKEGFERVESLLREEAHFNWVDDAWVGWNGERYFYDAQDRLVETITDSWREDQWSTSLRVVFEYGEQDSLVRKTGFRWENDTWRLYQEEHFDYDNDNKLQRSTKSTSYPEDSFSWAEYVYRDWNAEAQRWLEMERISFDKSGSNDGAKEREIWQYDLSGNVVEYFSQMRFNDSEEAVWVNNRKRSYRYNDDGEIVEENFFGGPELQEDLHRDIWIHREQYAYQFDAGGRLSRKLHTQEFSSPNARESETSYEYRKDNILQSELVRLRRRNEDWRNHQRFVYEPGADGLPQIRVGEVYRDDEWQTVSRHLYEYDEFGNCIDFVNQEWELNSFENWTRRTRKYDVRTDLRDTDNSVNVENPNLSVVPSPAVGDVHISYKLPSASFVKLSLYTSHGRRVATLSNEAQASGIHTVEFSGSGLAAGVYYCTLKVDSRFFARPIVLLK